MKAACYLRVSTSDQKDNGHSLSAQREALRAECARRGWQPVYFEDSASAKTMKRPALQKALDGLAAGKFEVLMSAKLDRISRSTIDFLQLMDRATREKWDIVVLDFNLDSTTPAGRLMAGMLAQFAEFERSLISQRTKAGLAQAKAGGTVMGPKAWKKPPSKDALPRIRELQAEGLGVAAIAARLNADGVPSPTGKKWWSTSVWRLACAEA